MINIYDTVISSTGLSFRKVDSETGSPLEEAEFTMKGADEGTAGDQLKDGSAGGHSLLKTTRTSLQRNSTIRCPILMVPNSSVTHRPRSTVR